MLHLTSATGARPLAAALARALAEVPSDPFAPEWIAVPSDGMRRWLTLELARTLGRSAPGASDGVVANVVPAYPGSLRTAVLASGRAAGEADPWEIERLTWTLMELAAESPSSSVFAPLQAASTSGSRYAKARAVADLLDRYHLHRPDMIRLWAEGRNEERPGVGLPDHARWQAEVWRLARERIGHPSPPEQLDDVLPLVAAGDVELALPDRLTFFGFTALPSGEFLRIAHAVGGSRDVGLYLLEPARFDVAGAGVVATSEPRSRTLHQDLDASVALPLLRSWGRSGRETSVLLADAGVAGVPAVATLATPIEPPTTLLETLQAAVRAGVPLEPLSTPAADDWSMQFHACVGATRQVEVARDTVLHLLADEALGLREEDIVIVCPQLERFQAAIEAVFGHPAPAQRHGVVDDPAPAGQGTPTIRYRIVDQSIARLNPVLGATEALLDLAAGPFDVESVLQFLALAPVCERFSLDDEAIAECTRWARDTQVRWGLDPQHRRLFGLPEEVTTNTWQAALDRLYLGAMIYDEDRLTIGDVLPYGVEGSDVATLGVLATVLHAVGALALVDGTRSPAEWLQMVRTTVQHLCAAPADAPWQMEAVLRTLATIEETVPEGAEIALTFTDLRKLIGGYLTGSGGRANFFRGGVTITSMRSLRWVPFPAVIVLGLDEAASGSSAASGDDLVAATAQFGDPDPRGELRQGALEALLTAEERFIVIREGVNVRSGQQVHRSVVASELFDGVLSVVAAEARPGLAARLEQRHARQAYAEREFTPAQDAPATIWSFDLLAKEAAVRRRRQPALRTPLVEAPLAPVAPSSVSLGALSRFLDQPFTQFFQRRLEAKFPSSDDALSTILPVEPSALEGWNIGDRYLTALLDGRAEEFQQVEERRGMLPPGSIGAHYFEELRTSAEEIARRAGGLGFDPDGERLSIDVELDDGTHVVGDVKLNFSGERGRGTGEVTYSKLHLKQEFRLWPRLLALVASAPDEEWRGVMVGRDSKGKLPSQALEWHVPGESAEERRILARQTLAHLVELYRIGLEAPLLFFMEKAEEVRAGKSVDSFASSKGGGRAQPTPEEHFALATLDGFALREEQSLEHEPWFETEVAGIPGSRIDQLTTYILEEKDHSLVPFIFGGSPDGAGSEHGGTDGEA